MWSIVIPPVCESMRSLTGFEGHYLFNRNLEVNSFGMAIDDSLLVLPKMYLFIKSSHYRAAALSEPKNQAQGILILLGVIILLLARISTLLILLLRLVVACLGLNKFVFRLLKPGLRLLLAESR